MKSCSLACLGYYPDSSAMALNDLFAYRQAYAGTWIFFSIVQPLKNDKDSLGIFGVQSDPIVADRKQPFSGPACSRHIYLWCLLSVKLDGITDQVLKKLAQLYPIRHHSRQRIAGYDRPAFLDRNP